MSNIYYTDNDTNSLDYCLAPKILMYTDYYINMSTDAFKLYIFLHDKLKISIKNGMKNDKNHYFTFMSDQEAADLFYWSKDYFKQLKSELKDYNLLCEIMTNQYKHSILYLKKCKCSQLE
ncbi:replication initiator protein A, partial [Staphylococcus sp. ACRSN]|uniref:replication initiator protein A n=1 Tax=Staphylococcus sp. ACRSN TaxID=2918214 RepID=UPI001EF23F24